MRTVFLSILLLCLLISGCVVGSVDPFYTPDLVVEKPELNGYWYYDESAKPEEHSEMYLTPGQVTIYDEAGSPLSAKLTFFQVNDVVYADIYPDKGPLKVDLVGENLPPVHLISMVKYENDRLTFNPLDYEWLAKEVQAGTISIPYTKAEKESDILFTATPAQWVEFLKTYGKDSRAFPSENESWMVRRTSAP